MSPTPDAFAHCEEVMKGPERSSVPALFIGRYYGSCAKGAHLLA
ncbi:hypothetical protein C725_1390 [Pacificimonas flava]|uniref:Uncharacterized protein n=1 Tax=Pacificimonas flava TaxID=1234595 RepID=M2TA73_9SPHN|nr:hypothetical protein C725_1390 [Pacificimonas flava]